MKKRSIALLLLLVLGITLLAGCGGGGGDALKGTWTGTDSNGSESTFTFDGKGGLKYSSTKDKGTYTISGSDVEIKVDWWDSARMYIFAVDGNKLTLTAPATEYYVDFDLTKK